MGLSIADIDKWSPESISAVGSASAARADAASQAGSRLKELSAFRSWQGAGADAAQARTQALALGLDLHNQDAAAVAKAASTAANEVRQVKTQLSELRSTLGQFGITVDAGGSRAVPPPNMASMSAANQKLVQDMTTIGQQSLDRLRQAADLTDMHLANAMKPKHDEFDLDTQFVRAQALPGGGMPQGFVDSSIDCGQYITALTGIATTLTPTLMSRNCDDPAG
ncbi:hypothetical protein H7J88_24600 [Mycolicibacterium flavescens]|uniref:Uncharacterized protein n=1 Tax=Mycolicibacterium flavescens TaxID=1776 RepID=A0A1E3RFW1_MYCFV|nr:hypothetical protein [Mycolicibacterium flavescens]MCV7282820.1 hypothetical protein [Mycolicibacterium flavescens]ODQ88729.1 hypothetical protein BHQ18_17875 [Mycolicibacterium flavescens]